MCHDLEVKEGEESCPYCIDNAAEGPKQPEISEEDCAFCKEKEAGEMGNCPYCKDKKVDNIAAKEEAEYREMGWTPPEIGKPNIDDHAPIGQNAPMDVEPSEDLNQTLSDQRDVAPSQDASVDPEDNHSKKALVSIAEEIGNDGNPPESAVDAIGQEDIGSGDDMEGNISRPEGFNQNTPSDMGEEGTNGISESKPDDDEPNFSSILEEGLDEHADSIQKERAVQMVSKALVEFKGCKDILEQNKAQMPQLYNASISILKAMIEMATVLKLRGNSPVQDESVLGQEQEALQPEIENEWSNPFPAHPDHGGDEKPGHAPGNGNPEQSPDEKGMIGQSIGKLSSKHTTQHIARTPMPIGAVNAKGQKKVQDAQGNIRFIDMKEGMVQGDSGVPVKPSKR